MDEDLPTVRVSLPFDKIWSFELAFQCRWFEVNQHLVAKVMHVLLRNTHSVSRESAVDGTNGLSIDGAPLASVYGDAQI